MSDIVERLRTVLHNDRSVELMNREAADDIERLRAELAAHVNENEALGKQQGEFIETIVRLEKQRDDAYGLILKWWFLLEILDDGEIMYARAAEGQRLMDDADKRAFLEATVKKWGGA